MLHVTNGTSVGIRDTSLGGEVIYWVDILHDGPVPAGLPLPELSRVRERFLADFFSLSPSQASLRERDAALENFRAHEEAILWFEHDLYDQLHLIQILDWFGERAAGAARSSQITLSLICVDRYLGRLRPNELEGLYGARRPVTEGQLSIAARAWAAFRAPQPAELLKLLDADTGELPFLRSALIRHLQQYPAIENGLSRTERQILEALRPGPLRFGPLFQANQAADGTIFMGDTTFERYVDGLRAAQDPFLRRDGDLFAITAFGEEALEGRRDSIETNGIDTWRGGVHLCPPAPVWRWDEARRTLTL